MIKDISKMSYSEFCEAVNLMDNLVPVLIYSDFIVYTDTITGRYFYLECGENDASDFFELELVARLVYDINHDLSINHNEAGSTLSALFECDCCGEVVCDQAIYYLWFKRK